LKLYKSIALNLFIQGLGRQLQMLLKVMKMKKRLSRKQK